MLKACLEISTNELRKIAAILPTLRYLMLRFCGSMTDEVLSYYSTQLIELKGIELGGPFLVTKSCYMQFFEARGPQLEELTITDTFRVDADVISSLVDNCPNLKELRLRQIVKLDNEAVRLLTGLTNLKVLEISDPGEDVQDGAVIDVLNSVGSGLRELDLSGCMLLTDQTLLAIRQCCPRLNTFSLTEAEDVTDEGVAQLFRNWDINPGLQYVNLSRLRKLTYFGIEAILEHSGRALEVLNINSCPLQPNAWSFWWQEGTKLERLRSLDVGFVRSVNDAVVEKLCGICPNLGELKVCLFTAMSTIMQALTCNLRKGLGSQPYHRSCPSPGEYSNNRKRGRPSLYALMSAIHLWLSQSSSHTICHVYLIVFTSSFSQFNSSIQAARDIQLPSRFSPTYAFSILYVIFIVPWEGNCLLRVAESGA